MTLTKSKQVHLFRQMHEHTCFVFAWDWPSMWAWPFEFLVTKIDFAQLCCWTPSDQASFKQTLNSDGVFFSDPLRWVTNSILYLFGLPPSLFLSHSALVKHIFQFFTILQGSSFGNREFSHGARETSSVFLENLKPIYCTCWWMLEYHYF